MFTNTKNAVIFLEVISHLPNMLETGVFTTKSKTGISFTCLVVEFLGYVKMSVISRCSFFAISPAIISAVKFAVGSCFSQPRSLLL